jgi:hypothetical protein
LARVFECVFTSKSGEARRSVSIKHGVIAGWTGRDPAAVEKHIVELEALGVKRPATTPIFYRVGAARFTTDQRVEAVGGASSGEVEFALLKDQGALWVGLGSDHTDREVETYNVTVSKQMCDKPFAPSLWLFDDVKDHWDKLILRSFIPEGGRPILYQEGAVSGMIAPLDLIGRLEKTTPFEDGTIMFCGTFAAKGGIRSAPEFTFELEDPVLARTIRHRYAIEELPNVG